MAVFTILLTFVGAYLVFMTGTYLLARVFFPLESSPQNGVQEVNIRRLSKQADRHLRKRMMGKSIQASMGESISPA